ncbi:MAG: membrane protein insertase YidC [Clostridiales bacterium]|jgi:YidC/Oxa1 family membrane protein insertase|nr:membrane protein insertase YidC [Clostridiales bacterium]
MQLTLIYKLGAGIWTPLTVIFGWLTSLLNEYFGSFGLAIIFLTIIIRGATMPLNIRSQKAMMKQQALSDKQAEIKRKYPDDKQKQEEELQKLFRENGISTLSGCLLPLLPILFLFPIWYVVRQPLQYVMGVSESNIKAMGELLNLKGVTSDNISLINVLTTDASAMVQSVGKGLIKVDQVLDMKFLGMNLGLTPSANPSTIMSDPGTYLPLLSIPIICLITTVIQTMMTNLTKPNAKEKKEEKNRAKANPANNKPDDPSNRTMKIFTYIMPLLMLWFTFSSPAAFGFYWIVGNLMSILQTVLTYYMFTKPFEEKTRELKEQKKNAFKKKKAELATETAGGSGKKKNK